MIATQSGATLAHAFKDTGVIARRNLLRNLRMPQLLLFATVQPVMFLLLSTMSSEVRSANRFRPQPAASTSTTWCRAC